MTSTSDQLVMAHDGLGNLTQYGDLQLVYTQTDQLTGASDGTTAVTFERTPDGNIYRKTTGKGSTDTSIRYTAGNLILDDSGKPVSQTLVIGTLLATLDLGDPSASGYTVTTLQNGNALLALDAAGAAQNLAAPALYSPWGQALNAPVPAPSRPNYGWQATNLLETNLNLVQMGKRTHLTGLGRFTSLDPVYGGGINAYNYANNDPVNNIDPNGTLSVAAFLGGTVGLAGTFTFFAKAGQTSTSFITQRILVSRGWGQPANQQTVQQQDPPQEAAQNTEEMDTNIEVDLQIEENGVSDNIPDATINSINQLGSDQLNQSTGELLEDSLEDGAEALIVL